MVTELAHFSASSKEWQTTSADIKLTYVHTYSLYYDPTFKSVVNSNNRFNIVFDGIFFSFVIVNVNIKDVHLAAF